MAPDRARQDRNGTLDFIEARISKQGEVKEGSVSRTREQTTKSSVFNNSFSALQIDAPVQKYVSPRTNSEALNSALLPPMGSSYGPKARWVRPESNFGASTFGASNYGSANKSLGLVHEAADYYEGLLFSIPFHQHDFDQPDIPQQQGQTMTEYGVVHTKLRKFIVVQKHPRSVVALPIYTHGGRGLDRKDEKNEFVSIREHDFRSTAAGAESDNGIIWADAFPPFKKPGASPWSRMTDRTSVLLTHPYTHCYNRKATLCGKLLPESLLTLKNLYHSWSFGNGSVAPVSPVTVKAHQDTVPTFRAPTKSRQGKSVTGNRDLDNNWLSSRSRTQVRVGPSHVYAPRR